MHFNRKYFICSKMGCYEKHYAKGLCRHHYGKQNQSINILPITLTPNKTQLDFTEESIFEEVFNNLNEREIIIIKERFGFEDGKPKTLRHIGGILGVACERIRQIEGRALKKLRHPKIAKKLRELL